MFVALGAFGNAGVGSIRGSKQEKLRAQHLHALEEIGHLETNCLLQ